MTAIALASAAQGCGDDLDGRPGLDGGGGDGGIAGGASDGRPPAVILFIGDGMGAGQIDAASLYRHGTRDGLAMQRLTHVGQVRTASPSGITDSAAAATVMATGVFTYNGRVGIDRDGAPVETLIERASRRGWASGVVTTTTLPHATPASFTSHVSSRGLYTDIAAQMVHVTHPDVMLGGGAAYFDQALHDELSAGGYSHVTTAAELAAAVAVRAPRLFGAFAPYDMTFVAGREAGTTEPTLVDMTAAALATLSRDPHGFLLMVEGGRIDHGGHANSLVDVVHDTLAFDDAVAYGIAWARGRGNVTVLVTADHETGGLEIVQEARAGEYPAVRWRWGNHTNDRVWLFAEGPGTEMVNGVVVDHRWVYELACARLDNRAPVALAPEPIPDGELGDLRHRAALQGMSTDFGAGEHQLDALWLDATPAGLFIGVEGLFGWTGSAVEVWIDADPSADTGFAAPSGNIADHAGVADAALSASRVIAPPVPFGADFALVSVAGADPMLEELRDDGGLRALRPPAGQPDNLGWLPAAINFGAVRARPGEPRAPVPGQGLEAFVPWAALYPGGAVPAGARLRLAVVLASATGELTSNQFLPPLPPASGSPGTSVIPLPGVIEYVLDADLDGVVDGDQPPFVLP